jgi:hydroxyacylglutathione hydrolase
MYSPKVQGGGMKSEQVRADTIVALDTGIYVVPEINPSRMTGGGVNTYVLGKESPLLIDTGSGIPAYFSLLETCLQQNGLGSITKVLLTHGHHDHTGGCAGLRQRFSPLTVYKMPLPAGKTAENFTTPYIPLKDGDQVTSEGFTLQAIYTPGHASDHLAYYLPEKKILFSGDVIIGSSTVVVSPDGGGLRAYLQSLERLRTMDIAVIYPGHGPIITNPQEKIQEYIARRQLREEQVLEALAAGATTIPAIVARIYTDIPKKLHRTAGLSILSHLLKLEEEGKVVSRYKQGEQRFYLC